MGDLHAAAQTLEHTQYHDKKARKDRSALRVNATKRPGYKIFEERL